MTLSSISIIIEIGIIKRAKSLTYGGLGNIIYTGVNV